MDGEVDTKCPQIVKHVDAISHGPFLRSPFWQSTRLVGLMRTFFWLGLQKAHISRSKYVYNCNLNGGQSNI